MKLVTFSAPGAGARIGVMLDEARILGLQDAHLRDGGAEDGAFSSMQSLIEAGPAALDRARALAAKGVEEAVSRLAEVRLLAPIPLPIQMRDCLCFEAHLTGSAEAAMRRSGSNTPSERHRGMLEVFKARPIYYKTNRFAVCGPETEVAWPSYSKLMDYELEMACVLGRGGRDIAHGEASGHIFGFTIFNDFSARDTQTFEMSSAMGPTKSKDFDNANAMGPCLVTADEFDPYNAGMTVRVNGEVRSVGHSSSMTYSFEDLIAFISINETLHAGEVLCSGTVGGGCGLEIGHFLESGDVVELEIEGIGRLRNRVVASPSSQTSGANS